MQLIYFKENYLKQVDLIIEYAYLCLDTYNYVKMINILEEAHKLLDVSN